MTYWLRQWSFWVGLMFAIGLLPGIVRLFVPADGARLIGNIFGLIVQMLIVVVFISHAARRAARARYLAEEGPRRDREREAALRHVERLRQQAARSEKQP
jgi:hypothetical protein